ncbi:hypothetical protein VAEKB19_5550016 [Vibrio aestuarianus]|nr:hypothetical protein VAEKB19_5550016 [Vibrio aestuarianus]
MCCFIRITNLKFEILSFFNQKNITYNSFQQSKLPNIKRGYHGTSNESGYYHCTYLYGQKNLHG